ncbi:tryptophan--tRNA ligase [Glycomyces algeriensis]|uniref:Tryptophan--tRNA ligase n=1 Tax=Glycomyces algeriensis TaxID=256037 RepID=A0A9W6G5B4_9ACTN|nr:tryptophan--tRNA ligase [Glycomyces algeriensis]MDA1367709.1 tryptophan--tRNA ligase [Glycomyces algeriensis]MDR7352927.1 tryptophanyl-tRNA synthetase [Glycomyces algeriensis]GLI40614.1 tryptophan--tRNA ligase [Glycomyces algeriensis]
MTTAERKPRVLSGIQPTSDSFHLGNYLGAIRQWVAMQDSTDAFYFVVDQHAITVDHDPKVLHQRSRVSAAQLLALGVDPERCTLFIQSQVPEHTMLAWILGTETGFGEASRMTQFKDKSAKQERTTVGLFTYPILQAADILLYQTDQVPVGEDQRQHLELTRDLAIRFNTTYGATFTVPDAYIVKETATIKDLAEPEKKMSKSSPSPRGCLYLLDEPNQMRKKIKSAVTDSDAEVRYDPEHKPGVSNLMNIYAALGATTHEKIEAEYAGKGYGDFKGDLAEVVAEYLGPISAKTKEFLADKAELDRILTAGAEKARHVAARTLAKAYKKVGFYPPVAL